MSGTKYCRSSSQRCARLVTEQLKAANCQLNFIARPALPNVVLFRALLDNFPAVFKVFLLTLALMKSDLPTAVSGFKLRSENK